MCITLSERFRYLNVGMWEVLAPIHRSPRGGSPALGLTTAARAGTLVFVHQVGCSLASVCPVGIFALLPHGEVTLCQ